MIFLSNVDFIDALTTRNSIFSNLSIISSEIMSINKHMIDGANEMTEESEDASLVMNHPPSINIGTSQENAS